MWVNQGARGTAANINNFIGDILNTEWRDGSLIEHSMTNMVDQTSCWLGKSRQLPICTSKGKIEYECGHLKPNSSSNTPIPTNRLPVRMRRQVVAPINETFFFTLYLPLPTL